MEEYLSDSPIVDEEDRHHALFSSKNLFLFLILIIFLNLFFVDAVIFQNLGILSRVKTPTGSSVPQYLGVDQTFCSQACIDKIDQATYSAKIQSLVTPAPSTPISNSSSAPKAQAREYYIPFGSGSGSSNDWSDVAGLQAYIDSTAYTGIKSVVFEVSVHIPTGNETASVRLINATDGRVISGSELTFNGNTQSVFMSSGAIGLDYGNKLYKVQIKTQLPYTAVVDQSRVHITAQ